MRKLSELFELVLTDGRYLSGNECNRDYLCFLVTDLLVEGVLTGDEHDVMSDAIYEMINGCAFLRQHLRDMGMIEYHVHYDHDEYKQAAYKFWSEEIAFLKSKGQ